MGDSKSRDNPGFDANNMSGEWELPEEFETGATIQIGQTKPKSNETDVTDEEPADDAGSAGEDSESVVPPRPSIMVEVIAEEGLDEAIKSIIPQVIDANEQLTQTDADDDPTE